MTKEEKKREANFLYEMIKVILPFPAKPEEASICEETWENLKIARDQAKLYLLQIALDDCVEMSESMSFENQAKLNVILMERFGMDLNTMKLRNKQKLDKALKRGYLKSDQEARMVEYWINEYCQAERPSEEIDPLNALLSDYERRVEAKWAAQKAAKEAKQAAKRIN